MSIFYLRPWQSSSVHDALGCFLENAPIIGSLAVRFTGSKRWIVPRLLDTNLWGLRQLLIAEVPSRGCGCSCRPHCH